MTPSELTPGTPVRIVSERKIAGVVLNGWVGEVWGQYRPGEIDDWCLVKVTDHSTIIVGFAPEELESP